MVHGNRSVNVDLDDGGTWLFERAAMKKNTTKTYREAEELRNQLAGTVLEARTDKQLEESVRERRRRQKPNMEGVEPRRSLRLAKKSVTMGRQGTVGDPEVLPYYMEAVERGYAGTRQRGPRDVSEDDITEEAPDRDSVNATEQGDTGMDSGEAAGEDPLEEQ